MSFNWLIVIFPCDLIWSRRVSSFGFHLLFYHILVKFFWSSQVFPLNLFDTYWISSDLYFWLLNAQWHSQILLNPTAVDHKHRWKSIKFVSHVLLKLSMNRTAFFDRLTVWTDVYSSSKMVHRLCHCVERVRPKMMNQAWSLQFLYMT